MAFVDAIPEDIATTIRYDAPQRKPTQNCSSSTLAGSYPYTVQVADVRVTAKTPENELALFYEGQYRELISAFTQGIDNLWKRIEEELILLFHVSTPASKRRNVLPLIVRVVGGLAVSESRPRIATLFDDPHGIPVINSLLILQADVREPYVKFAPPRLLSFLKLMTSLCFLSIRSCQRAKSVHEEEGRFVSAAPLCDVGSGMLVAAATHSASVLRLSSQTMCVNATSSNSPKFVVVNWAENYRITE